MAISNDEKLMRLALREARKGLGLTASNPPVGAVIVSADGMILGKGWHHGVGQPHAEVEAIADATKQGNPITGATIYVTLEPCSTHGRTPPCCDAIQQAGLAKVVMATLDPNPAHAGNAIGVFEKAGINTAVGVCEDEAQHLIRFFAKHITTGRPWVIAKSAITLDGRTTLAEGAGQWISGKESRADVHRIRSEVDAVLIGGETLRQDDPQLTIRNHPMNGRPQPWRVIMTAQKELPTDLKVFTDEYADRTMVQHGKSLTAVLNHLGNQGISSVMMESGGRLFTHGLANGLIDEVVLYVAPIIGGGNRRVLPVDDFMTRLEDVEVKPFGADLRISGHPILLPTQ